MHNEIKPLDKAIVIGSYLTGGWIGIFWQIFCAIKKRPLTKFLIFNIYQSIFLSLLLVLAGWLFSGIEYIINFIPYINTLFNQIAGIFIYPAIFNRSIIELLIFTLYFYIIACCLFGKITRVPKMSEIILYQVNRY